MLRVVGLEKRFRPGEGPPVTAVDHVSFELETGRLLTLLGPSGCGKTTVLRSIAGLEDPDDGQIQIGPLLVYSRAKRLAVPPNRRHVGMVFQSYAIWPHMTVFENVAYPLDGGGVPKATVRKRVLDALELVDLAQLGDRPAPLLSGGQQQRVALARALVAEPEVLLLDEPLSNLDAKLREQMRVELRALQQRVGLTSVYVTHDQLEALAISDVIALMNGGQLVELGVPRQIYDRPTTRFAAEFIGSANVIPVTAPRRLGEYGVGEAPWGEIRFRWTDSQPPVAVAIRPEDLQPGTHEDEPNNWLATVNQVVFQGATLACQLSLGGTTLSSTLARATPIAAGQPLRISARPDCCIPLVR
jgi:ABC-type Fe3+/spermidine/putrescine transport system ATPase subunit